MTKHIKVITHTDCNLGCSYCFQTPWRHLYNNVTMSNSVIKRIFNIIASSDDQFDISIMGGETYLRPDVIREFCILHKYYDFSPNNQLILFTNGTILTDDIKQIYSEYRDRLYIVITLHSYRDSHLVDKVIDHVNLLNDMNIPINLQMIITTDINLDDFCSTLLKLLNVTDCVKLRFEYVTESDYFNKVQLNKILRYFVSLQNSVQDESIRVRLVNSISTAFKLINDIATLPVGDRDTITSNSCVKCGAGVTELSILPNGDIYPCENIVHKMKDEKLINIFDIQSFESLKDDSFYKDMIFKYNHDIYTESGENCDACLLRSICNECTCEYSTKCHNDIHIKSDIRCKFTQDIAEVQLDYLLELNKDKLDKLMFINTAHFYNIIERNGVECK